MNDIILMNRRKFMEQISVLAGSSIAATSMPWLSIFTRPAYAGVNPSDRVRLGVIGVGDRGRTLILNIQEIQKYENVEIAAVCDTYEPHYQRGIKLTGGKAKAFFDYREMLEMDDLDGVIITTPLHEHARQTIDALEAGIHVYCEKSMARTLEDTKRMYDAHINTGKILVIGHQRLYSPVYLEGIERIHKGELGKITHLQARWHRNWMWRQHLLPDGTAEWLYSWGWEDWQPGTIYPLQKENPELDRKINWRLYDEYSAGLITELATHHFQVANWVMQTQPVSVVGKGSLNFWNDGRDILDNFSCILKYPNDTFMLYDCLDSNKHNGMQVQVLGNLGTMELESNKKFIEDWPRSPAIRKLIQDIEQSIFDVIPIGGATWIPQAPQDYLDSYISDKWKMNETKLFLEGFVKHIREGKIPEKLAREGYYASIWGLLAEKAIKTGNEVTLPEGYEI